MPDSKQPAQPQVVDEDADFRLAMELQHQEDLNEFQNRKRQYDSDPQRMRISASFVSLGTRQKPYRPNAKRHQHQHNRYYHQTQLPLPKSNSTIGHPDSARAFRGRGEYEPLHPSRSSASHRQEQVPAAASMPMSPCKPQSQAKQEEKDHRLAAELQEMEDSFAKHNVDASADSSRRSGRSNAMSQANRLNHDSFVNMMQGQGQVQAQPGHGNNNNHNHRNDPGEGMEVAIRNHRAAGSTATDDSSSSLIAQLGNQIFGTLGSWDPYAARSANHAVPDEVPASKSHDGQQYDSSSPTQSVTGSHSTAPHGHSGGQQLLDAREGSPQPRGNEVDWPSRVGSCHSWLPDTLGATSLFGFTNPPPSGAHANGQHFQTIGLSPVNSLEMDVSAAGNSQGSVGGGSLCQVFDPQVFDPPVDKLLMHMMPPEDVHMMPSPQAIQQVPSWERSMRSHRSRSPINLTASLDEEEESILHVSSLKATPSTSNRQLVRPPEGTILPSPRSMDPADTDHHQVHSLDDMEWE